MAKGLFRRIADKVTTTTEKVTNRVVASVKAPFKRKPKTRKTPTTPAPKPKPTPAVAREMLHAKLQDMYWLQRKWDAAAMSKRINKMSDAQVYAALDMTENDIETAVRDSPRNHPEWASPDDPNSNILWYHGGETINV